MTLHTNSGIAVPAHIAAYVEILGEDGAIAFFLERKLFIVYNDLRGKDVNTALVELQ